jgi:hypothetical protein
MECRLARKYYIKRKAKEMLISCFLANFGSNLRKNNQRITNLCQENATFLLKSMFFFSISSKINIFAAELRS